MLCNHRARLLTTLPASCFLAAQFMSTETEPIICRSTRWYHLRRIPMLVMVLGFSAWFFHDWKTGYPLKRESLAEWNRLEKEKGKEGVEAAYAVIAKERGWPAKPDLEKQGWDDDKWNYALAEQLVCAILAGGGGLVMLYFYIRTTRGSLRADATSFSTPDGQHVPFASAFRIDRRKWDHKGLAYVYYKDGVDSEKRAVIDDLIFGGAVKVLDRLTANFQGEVIDLEKPEATEATDLEKSSHGDTTIAETVLPCREASDKAQP